MGSTRPLEMKISISAIEHLGMNLYSNTPAVLSEVVANAWDADGEEVSIKFANPRGTVSVRDNGSGMTRDEVIDRFLVVGFRRRDAMGPLTPRHKREPMGRKGIGKLSCFSIANVVKVYTVKDGERTAFEMDANKIKARMEANHSERYPLEELDDWPDGLFKGTEIVLGSLKRNVTQLTVKGLRQRLARRFSILGVKHHFVVKLNGEEIAPADRGYLDKIEYLWTYGDQSEILPGFTNLSNERTMQDRTKAMEYQTAGKGISVSGWLGTAKSPSQLKDEGGQNLNHIAVFMRGKLAQEDLLADFGAKEIYADYLAGEIHCDALDLDDTDDIATSSRQAFKSDDPRFQSLKEALGVELRHIANRWGEWRRADGGRRIAREVPEVTKWLENLPATTKKRAENWIGRLNAMRTNSNTERRELLKASILAFESYRRKEQLDFLERITDEGLESILQVFNDIDDLQLSYYGQIVKLRLGVVTALSNRLSKDALEATIRDHIYDHLWLVDPSWERVRGTETAEKTVGKFLQENTDTLSTKEKRARIDIGYRTASGRHVIIELKRASVAVGVDMLARQIRKYRDGARKLLAQGAHPRWPLDIVCLVGEPPPEWGKDGAGRDDVEKTLGAVGARLLFYNELLENAERAYADYLEAHREVDRLWPIFQAIDDFDVTSA